MTFGKSKEEEMAEYREIKYGKKYPEDIGFGKILWIHVPMIARVKSPFHIANIPYLTIEGYDNGCFKDNSKLVNLSIEQLKLLGMEFDPYKI